MAKHIPLVILFLAATCFGIPRDLGMPGSGDILPDYICPWQGQDCLFHDLARVEDSM